MTQTPFTEAEIQQAIERGTRRYFDQCREALPGFIDRHFRYPGAIQTNRVAIGLGYAARAD